MLPKNWRDALSELKEECKGVIEIFDFEDVDLIQDAFNEPNLQMKLLKIQLLENLNNAQDGALKDEYAHILAWMFETDVVLEQLLCSGDVPKCRWFAVINILCEILNINPNLMREDFKNEKNCWQLRLAVATALTFSSSVISVADKDVEIDAYKRFNTFVGLAGDKSSTPLLHTFYKLSCWHLRYVIGSWAEDDELEWARTNMPKKFLDSSKIGEATHEMVPYRLNNDEGVSVHEGAKYYKNEKVTLQKMHEIGGVCGAVSRFGAAMSQAHGVPAMPVAQPGHCAFLWWKEGKWAISNDDSGLNKSTVHDGIQFPWCTKDACYVMLMNDAQEDFCNYKMSEVLRIASYVMHDSSKSLALLSHSLITCHSNFPTWNDLAAKLGNCEIEGLDLLPILSKHLLKDVAMDLSDDISSYKHVQVSDCNERANNLVDGTDSEWWTENDTAWIEIDLLDIYHIREVYIKWWGVSVSKSFNIFASSNENYQQVKNHLDDENNIDGYNQWSKFKGWSEPTRQIRFDLKDGQLDPWSMNKKFGIRQIVVKGQKVSSSKQITDATLVSTSFENLEDVNKLMRGEKCCLVIDSSSVCFEIEFPRPTFVQNVHLVGNDITKHLSVSISGSMNGEKFVELIKSHENSTGFTIYNCQAVVNSMKFVFDMSLNNKIIEDNLFLSQLLIHGNKLNTKDVLSLKLKKELPDYQQVCNKVEEIYDEASSQNLSHLKPVLVSDCQDRGSNLVDGTGSEWWTENEIAYIEIDLESSCLVTGLQIRWWGTSVSSNMTVSALEHNTSKYIAVKESKDEIETPNDINGWSCFSGWDIPTTKIRLDLKDGSLDPWGMNKYFGIRQIIVKGRKIQ